MTRLFIRFYLGVVLILIAAWLIQSWVFRGRGEAQNVRVVEEALGGGARLARDYMLSMDAEKDQVHALSEIRSRFDYDVNWFPLDASWIVETNRKRLANGSVVLQGPYITIGLVSQNRSQESSNLATDERSDAEPANKVEGGLIFGPLPPLFEPTQTEVAFGYGAVFLLAALAIAVLLRPVASQMRAVERTAALISEGELSARIDESGKLRDVALVKAFNSMADRTEVLLRSQRELLQAVSHELRTPLARIRFATDLVETAKSSDERRIRLDAIDDATEKLDDLVGELLTYVRMDSDAARHPAESIDLNHMITELSDIHDPLHSDIQIQPVLGDQPLTVVGDRESLSRAVENLITNAARHAKGVVRIVAARESDSINIIVEDDGPGIPRESREKVFDPFVRLDHSNESGTGLGLALVSRIAKRLGGSASVEESDLGGAKLILHFPASSRALNSSTQLTR